MKAIINKVDAVSNSQFNINVTVSFDDGTTQDFDMGFNAVFTDTQAALDYVKSAILNRANQYLKETASVAKSQVDGLVGKEFTL